MTMTNTTSSDQNILQAPLYRDIVFGLADDMTTGLQAVNTRPIPGIDFGFTIAEQTYFEAQQIAEGAVAENKTATWFEITDKLDKYQIPMFFNDEVKARQMDNVQIAYSLQCSAEGLAKKQEDEIFTVLTAGAGQSVDATAKWTSTTGSDPATDIANAVTKILSNTMLPTSAVADIKVFYPMPIFAHLKKPIEVGQIQESVENWTKRELSIGLIPTRQMTTGALALVKTDRSAIRFEHDLSRIPGYEPYREVGVGDGVMFTRLFKTKIMPAVKGGSTSNFICKINTVA